MSTEKNQVHVFQKYFRTAFKHHMVIIGLNSTGNIEFFYILKKQSPTSYPNYDVVSFKDKRIGDFTASQVYLDRYHWSNLESLIVDTKFLPRVWVNEMIIRSIYSLLSELSSKNHKKYRLPRNGTVRTYFSFIHFVNSSIKSLINNRASNLILNEIRTPSLQIFEIKD